MEVTNEIRDTFQNYPPRQHRKDLSYINQKRPLPEPFLIEYRMND